MSIDRIAELGLKHHGSKLNGRDKSQTTGVKLSIIKQLGSVPNNAGLEGKPDNGRGTIFGHGLGSGHRLVRERVRHREEESHWVYVPELNDYVERRSN